MNAAERRRGVLEAVLASADATAGDRLRALEMLAEFERAEPHSVDALVAEMSDSAIDEEIDRVAVDAARAILADDTTLGIAPDAFPALRAYLPRAIAERVQAGIAAAVDLEARAAEISAAAQEEAQRLYESRSFRVLTPPEPQEAASAEPPSERLDGPPEAEPPALARLNAWSDDREPSTLRRRRR